MLEKELEVIVRRFKSRHRVVNDSISKIIIKARRLRSPESIRKAMEAVE
jgi:hypothetical protein